MDDNNLRQIFCGLGAVCRFDPWLVSLSDDGDLRIVISAITEMTEDGFADLSKLDTETSATVRSLFQGKAPFPPVSDGHSYKTPFPHYWFEIVFPHYITYSVCNESYARPDPDAIGRGQYFVLFEKSAFLEGLGQTIDLLLLRHAHGIEQYTHYGIYTSEHVIDILSPDAPRVTVLGKTL